MADTFGPGRPIIRIPAGISPVNGAQLTNDTNSTAPGDASLSNTAASYTTLGGKWRFDNVAGAETDFALFGFTMLTGWKIFITGDHGTGVDVWVAYVTNGEVCVECVVVG